MTEYRKRSLGPIVLEALGDLPVVVVTGLRQAGKSTFLQAEPGLEGRAYRSLDDFAQLAAARADPEAFVKADGPLTIDEVQKCPELLPAIKRAVDRDRRPGWFLLSGSANLALLRGIPESLAGRAVYLTLHPFTRNEIAGIPTGVAYLRRLFDEGGLPKTSRRPASVTVADLVTGGMPSVCLGEVRNPGLWFQGYEQTYLERDVRDLARVADLVSFRSLLRLAALRTGQVLKVSELGRDAKLPVATASRYLALMEVSFVLRRLGPYLPSTASRLIKSPKIYVADSGLAAHLVGASSSALSADANLRGALFETYVAQNLASLIETGWPGARLHYWHVQGRYEVDFVIEVGRESLAVELKSYGRWSERDLAGLRAFLDRTPRCRAGILAHNGEQAVKLGERLWAIPIALLLSS